jgi:hypothetical protein
MKKEINILKIQFFNFLIGFIYPLFLILLWFFNSPIYTTKLIFFSWNLMFYWIFYIIPISYYLFLIIYLHKEFYCFFKEIFSKKEIGIPLKVFNSLIYFLFPIIFDKPEYYFNLKKVEGYNKKENKYLVSYYSNIVSYLTFFISIYSFFDRFLKKLSFQIELLSGDLFFIIIPFVMSLVFISNPIKKIK